MKKIIIIIAFIAFYGAFSNQALANTSWQHYVFTDKSQVYGAGKLKPHEQRKIFKKQLEKWKENKKADTRNYVALGFSQKLAEQAVKEKIQWAEKVIKLYFLKTLEIPKIVQFAENRAKLMKHITGLGYERFNKLAKKYGYTNTLPLYKCLCSSAGIAGSSRGFSPARDKHCNNNDPCKGGNFGCSSGDFPKTWGECARLHLTGDGENIFRAISENTNISREKDTGLERLVHILKNRNQSFKSLCLPSLTDKNIDNILNSSDFIKSPTAAKRAISISENTTNRCEEAVALNLFLMSKQSKTLGLAITEGVLTWNPLDKFFAADNVNKAIFNGLLKEGLSKTIDVTSKINNIISNITLFEKEYKNRTMDPIYKETFELFQESKKWTDKEINDWEKESQQHLQALPRQIKKELQQQLIADYDAVMSKPRIYTDGSKTQQDLIYQEQQEHRRNAAVTKLVIERFRIQLKMNMIRGFRKPFNEHGCEKYLSNSKDSCKKKLAQEKQKYKESLQQEKQKLIQEQLKRGQEAIERIEVGKGKGNILSGGKKNFVPGVELKK